MISSVCPTKLEMRTKNPTKLEMHTKNHEESMIGYSVHVVPPLHLPTVNI